MKNVAGSYYFYFRASSTGHLYLLFQDAIILSKTRCLLELSSFFELEFVVINSVIQNEGTKYEEISYITLSHYYGISYQRIIYHIYIVLSIIYYSIYLNISYIYISIYLSIYLYLTIYYIYISSNQRVARSIIIIATCAVDQLGGSGY